MNPIQKALDALGVILPETPVDLSAVLAGAGITHPFVIAMTGRSGSTWLASALGRVPGMCEPHEYFSEEGLPHYGRSQADQTLEDFFADLVKRHGKAGTFGFKSDAQRLGWLGEVIDLERTFGPATTKWVDLRRWNLVKQAFSYARARASGVWHDFGGAERPAGSITPEDAAIFRDIARIVQQERWFDRHYHKTGIQPLKINYEEIYDSGIQLTQRVLYHIDPERAWPFEALEGGKTQKLSKPEDAAAEDHFVARNIALVSEIMGKRGAFNPDDRDDTLPIQ